jgi:hypothetical protein
MTTIEEFIDTQARNQRLAHYDVKVAMVPFEHPRMLVRGYRQQKSAISADRNLTNEGKAAALDKARTTTRAAISEWKESRLKNIDADLLEQKAGLMTNTGTPDPKRVDLMTSHLLKHTPSDIAIFYNSASEDERRAMEAASASVGRVPMKTSSGLEWKTLLDPDMVSESILARAEQTNPTAAQKVRELAEIRAMTVTITGVALSEI